MWDCHTNITENLWQTVCCVFYMLRIYNRIKTDFKPKITRQLFFFLLSRFTARTTHASASAHPKSSTNSMTLLCSTESAFYFWKYTADISPTREPDSHIWQNGQFSDTARGVHWNADRKWQRELTENDFQHFIDQNVMLKNHPCKIAFSVCIAVWHWESDTVIWLNK